MSVTSTQQREVRIQRETRDSVVTTPITGLINFPHNVGVNPYYGGILGDKNTPMTSYK